MIETPKNDYSMSEIARIAESENVSILASFVTQDPSTNNLVVTLKLNTQELFRVAKAYERFEYNVYGSFTEDAFDDGLKERYDSLLRYLNV